MATMTDIAREAGVSLSTVSYALSGKRPISDATRERVQAAIDRLDFHPRASARALALQRTSLLGLAVPQRPDVDDHVVMEFVGSILGAAHEQDYDVLLVTAEDHARTLRVAEEGKVDALIVMDVVEGDARIPSLARLHSPVVLIGNPQDAGGLACVDFDFLAGAMLAVRELHARGASRVAMLKPPSAGPDGPVPTYARRSRLGYAMACAELGMESHVVELPPEPEAVTSFVRDHLVEQREFDGLFVHHEPALALLGRTLLAQGVHCPDDLQVVAVSPADVAMNGPWEVSSVDIPIPAIGQTSVAMALERLSTHETPAHARLLSPAFVPRGTTRAR
ncbi:LacI family DNA-binding transcriptional regulator [Brachybacterium saurashtrense]|uniref:LacI family transcriptional regulator n=1 Tax=Brachybacterium saurashtrense TaxID=556288 RepID=A0A345YS83_9MICO|nr:LacI family DNA-binding transcriptional regulator [Brachybacterium saurashtrense]AXK46785.1 LacI family transcriptional regulator [Brachybacterium saurashtrense]RRR22500.1 LacI family transcriptional regulator [Brachybacterium saurashtrense]